MPVKYLVTIEIEDNLSESFNAAEKKNVKADISRELKAMAFKVLKFKIEQLSLGRPSSSKRTGDLYEGRKCL